MAANDSGGSGVEPAEPTEQTARTVNDKHGDEQCEPFEVRKIRSESQMLDTGYDSYC